VTLILPLLLAFVFGRRETLPPSGRRTLLVLILAALPATRSGDSVATPPRFGLTEEQPLAANGLDQGALMYSIVFISCSSPLCQRSALALDAVMHHCTR
jgi:hypothetical protein